MHPSARRRSRPASWPRRTSCAARLAAKVAELAVVRATAAAASAASEAELSDNGAAPSETAEAAGDRLAS